MTTNTIHYTTIRGNRYTRKSVRPLVMAGLRRSFLGAMLSTSGRSKLADRFLSDENWCRRHNGMVPSALTDSILSSGEFFNVLEEEKALGKYSAKTRQMASAAQP